MMTLRQLRCLDALAATEHFGRAAERVNVSQPALSAQIKQIETHLGVVLVDRIPTGARLTRSGREIAGRASAILAGVGDIEAYARSLSGPLSGPLSLGIIPSLGPYALPHVLPLLRQRFPELSISVRETVTETLVDELLHGDLDLIVASLPLDQAGIAEQVLHRDRFRLAVPAVEPEPGGPVRLDEIAEDRLLLLEEGHCLRDQVLAVCSPRLRVTRLAPAVTNLTTMLELVAAGQGITLLPDLFAATTEIDNTRIRLVEFKDPGPLRLVGCAWRQRNPRQTAFTQVASVIEQALAELPAV